MRVVNIGSYHRNQERSSEGDIEDIKKCEGSKYRLLSPESGAIVRGRHRRYKKV